MQKKNRWIGLLISQYLNLVFITLTINYWMDSKTMKLLLFSLLIVGILTRHE